MARGDKLGPNEDLSGRIGYERTRLVVDVVSAVEWALSEQHITRSEFARRLGVTPGRATQILSGNENLTLATLAAVALAVDGRFKIQLELGESPQPTDEETGPPPRVPVELVSTDSTMRRQPHHRRGHKPGSRLPSSRGSSTVELRRSSISLRIWEMFSLRRASRLPMAASSPS